MPLQNVRSQYAIPAIKFHFPLAASMCPYCTCVRAARIFVVTVIGNEERWTSYILCLVRFSGWRSRGFADSPGKVLSMHRPGTITFLAGWILFTPFSHLL
eukprot:c20557_g3_i3 orf=233-532(+)